MEALPIPFIKGTDVSFHLQIMEEPMYISKLITLMSSSGEILKKKPRCIGRNASALVEITSRRPICLETFVEYRALGRFSLRDRGVTLAAGIITALVA